MNTSEKEIVHLRPNSVHYSIPGQPMPLARARFGKSINKCWDSQKQSKLAFGIQLQHQHNARPFFEGPIHVDLKFFMRMPAKSKLTPNSMHHTIPDLDNLIKFILDVGNGILWHDDSHISSITSLKVYSDDPHTELIVLEVK